MSLFEVVDSIDRDLAGRHLASFLAALHHRVARQCAAIHDSARLSPLRATGAAQDAITHATAAPRAAVPRTPSTVPIDVGRPAAP